MGGEPLYHKRFYEFIDWCLANEKTDFHLTFVTNGTLCNVELLNKLKHFKSIQIEISIENLHETNNYIRINSSYTVVKENILNMVKYLGINSIVIRTVPQALSIIHYDTLLDFAIDHKLPIDSNIIYKPEHLKCYVLPKELKDILIDKIKTKYANILSHEYSDNPIARIRTNNLQGIKNHIEAILILLDEREPDNIEDLRHQFVEYNNKLDSVTEYKFTEIYPELLKFYAKYSTI